MDRKLLRNYFYNILYQVVTILAPMITVPYTTRVLGDMLGVNAFSGSVVQWFVIFGIMGINNYGIKTVGANRDDRALLSRTFRGIFFMQMCNMILALIVYLSYVAVSPLDYKVIYIIQALTIISIMFDISWFFMGVEDFKINALRNILIKIVGVALIFLLVKKESDLWKFVLINGGVAVLGQMIMFLQLPKYIDRCHVSIGEAYREHFKDNLILFIPQVATSVYNILDQTLVGLLAADWEAQSAYYQQAIRLVRMFLYFITSIGAVIMPRIANVYHKGDHKQVEAYLSVTMKLAFYLAIPIMFGTATVAPSLIPWFMDPHFAVVSKLIIVACPVILLVSLSNVYGIQYLLPTGKMKEYSASVVIGALVNLCANIILIPKYGALGACIAIVMAEASVTLSQIIFIRGKLKLEVKARTILLYFADAVIMGAVVLFIGRMMGPRLLTNLVQVASGAVIYLGILTLFKEEFHMDILKKAQGLISRH